ncbi:MAG: metal ABC transporter permease, partial [Sedimenticola sp.]
MSHITHAYSRPHEDRRDWHNLRGMLPYLWDYRGRALLALVCLVLAKMANVGIPLVLKEIVDGLEKSEQTLLV